MTNYGKFGPHSKFNIYRWHFSVIFTLFLLNYFVDSKKFGPYFTSSSYKQPFTVIFDLILMFTKILLGKSLLRLGLLGRPGKVIFWLVQFCGRSDCQENFSWFMTFPRFLSYLCLKKFIKNNSKCCVPKKHLLLSRQS